jgi:hypothetical protein
MWESQRDFQRVWEAWASRLYGFPCFPYSVISMVCFGNAYSETAIARLRDDMSERSARTCGLRFIVGGCIGDFASTEICRRGEWRSDDPSAFIRSHHDDGLVDNESISLFSSTANAWSGGPFIESAQDLHELASQQDERAPQYQGYAIE